LPDAGREPAEAGAPDAAPSEAGPARDARTDARDPIALTEAATLPPLAPDCLDCLTESCGIPLRVCRTSEDCLTLLGCLSTPERAGCQAAFSCLEGALTFAEAGACVSALVSNPNALDYIAALTGCSSSQCGAKCPVVPPSPAAVTACEDGFDRDFVSVLSTCGETRTCACERCNPEMRRCFDDPACLAITQCRLEKGCSGSACGPACSATTASVGGLTDAAVLVDDCLDSQCSPCGAP